MNQLVNMDGSINSHDFFTFSEGVNKGKKLKIIGTQSCGVGVSNCMESIKNLDSGEITTVKRGALLKLNSIIVLKYN